MPYRLLNRTGATITATPVVDLDQQAASTTLADGSELVRPCVGFSPMATQSIPTGNHGQSVWG